MKKTHLKAVGLLLTTILVSSAYSQSFWFGNPIATFLDPNTANAYHDFLADAVLPELSTAVRVFNNNPENDTGVTIYDPGRCWNGYTLLNSMSGHQPDSKGPLYTAILIDMEGHLVKEWVFGKDDNGLPMKMLPGGYVMGGSVSPDDEGHLIQVDWDGNVVWKAGRDYHHDYQRQGNPVGYYAPGMEPMADGGKTLILSHSYPSRNLTSHISDFSLLDEILRELDTDANVVCLWQAWKHFEQLGFDDAAKDALRTVEVPARRKTTDWLHANSASWIGPNPWYNQGDYRFHPDNIILSLRNVNITVIIARHNHPDGNWDSGDIVWRIGPDYSTDMPEHELGQIIGQHHAHMIPRGLPGAGNILIFDNGGDAGFGAIVPGLNRGTYPNTIRDFSRVIEFNPITLDMVWEYRQQHPTEDRDGDGDIRGAERKFYSIIIGGAQRLENGNTLICEGVGGRIIEVTLEGDIVWEYLSPYAGPADALLPDNKVYRAYRVPASWIPQLDGIHLM
jgi:hypothetical protein